MPSRHRRGQLDATLTRGLPRGGRPAGLNPDVVAQCPTAGCGEAEEPVASHGWIRAEVRGSSLPARWFCSPRCQSVGVALAQLRLVAAPPK